MWVKTAQNGTLIAILPKVPYHSEIPGTGFEVPSTLRPMRPRISEERTRVVSA
jgi:hypothetical protein